MTLLRVSIIVAKESKVSGTGQNSEVKKRTDSAKGKKKAYSSAGGNECRSEGNERSAEAKCALMIPLCEGRCNNI